MLGLRIPQELRDALDCESALTQANLTDVAISWLQAGREVARDIEIQRLRRRLADLEAAK